MKGKHAVSYRVVNGIKISVWVDNLGGYDVVTAMIKTDIQKGMCRLQISLKYNITLRTAISFIRKHLHSLVDFENINYKTNTKIRQSLSQKGKINKNRGKTYKEIYGEKKVNCGFKRGDLNPNFTRNKYIGCKKQNKFGEKYRSNYEVLFSEKLHEYNICFSYEDQFKLNNGKVKIVDFVVGDNLVEITGYAYKQWQDDFDSKIALLHVTYPFKKIIIITDSKWIDKLKHTHPYAQVFSISDDKYIDYLLK